MKAIPCWFVFGVLWLPTLATHALEIELPPETAALRPSPLPGYALARQHCVACHSVDYISSQPPGSSREYWEKTVRKMKTAFGWPLPEQDVAPLVDYLAQTYAAAP